ncbi:hypothetical protein CSAL01_04680 [Colletotrichum salicis]|uniref:Uncharacterized protein n=1 Tax=Colletotrichum salicis TaxID=1209931 RepID=A0A135UW32_9PEZI|nr:hypothetical protein CSAL01_04680 [Colletotrichum salicis]
MSIISSNVVNSSDILQMANIGPLSSGIKSEDIPIPSRELSREFALPFRPSPAPPNRSPSWALHLFATVFGVLYANKNMVMDWRQSWNKVQRLLAKENQVWRTEVTAIKIRDLVQLFADARIN